ncbi:MAG: hypothetical protein V1826_01605 [bacterium]
MKQALIPLVYFAQSKRPLTLKQIRRYSWGREFGLDELKQILKKTGVSQAGEFYYLSEEHLEEIPARQQRSEKFWRKVKRYSWVFANVPFLRMAAVSNTLAYNYVSAWSDIDLFIVAAEDRLWTTRGILLLWLTLLGVRARGRNKYMRFSPEILVDETAIDLSPCALADDYLVHYQIADITPVWNTAFFDRFWSANAWLKGKLPVAYRSPLRRVEFERRVQSSWFAWLLGKILSGGFGDRVEAWARRRQRWLIERAKNRLGVDPNVIIEDHVIETHFHGQRADVRDAIEEFLAS